MADIDILQQFAHLHIGLFCIVFILTTIGTWLYLMSKKLDRINDNLRRDKEVEAIKKSNEYLEELIGLNEAILYRFKHLNRHLGISYGPLNE